MTHGLVVIISTAFQMMRDPDDSTFKEIISMLLNPENTHTCTFLSSATDNGRDCFRCVDRHVLSILTTSMRYLGYAYLCTVVFEFWMLSLEALQGRISSNLKLSRNLVWIISTFIALKFLPVGYYAFSPWAHCFFRTIKFGTLVLESASPELSFTSKSWKEMIRSLEAVTFAAIAAVQFWVYIWLQCDSQMSWVNLQGAMAASFNAFAILME